MRISDEHLREWQNNGYTVVENFLSSEELGAARLALASTFPPFEQYALMADSYRSTDQGGYQRELPYLGDTLNFIALHPDLIDFAERALGTTAITLIQSLVWAKYGGIDSCEQSLHSDHMAMSLLSPDPDAPPEEITFILYYVDVDETAGTTYVVPRQYTRDDLLVPYIRPVNHYAAMYEHERPVVAPAGSLLIFTNFLFHRGSAIRTGHTRFSHHIMYRPQAAPWNGHSEWANFADSPEMMRFIELATPRQRELIGFPPLGHAYWSEGALRRIAARYPEIDMTPYVDHAPLSDEVKERVRQTLPDVKREAKARNAPALEAAAREYNDRLTSTVQDAYWRGFADYCAALSGVPSSVWLYWIRSAYR